MKKCFRILAYIAVVTLIVTSCGPQYYSPGNGYNYAYGDGQPGDNYGYDQPPVYSNDPNYQYQQQQVNSNDPNYQYQQQQVYSNDPNYQYQQQANVAANQPPAGFNDFYNQLSPYGTWVNIAPYGQVWIANVVNFQPYSTNGYWTYTNYGWTWVSNYSWGWAPFHYGRWGYNNRYGWYWVPGYVWGPAWVAWSSSSDMYGWAPLMPGMNYGVNLSVNLFPSSYWTFMPGRYMGSSGIGGYYVDRSRNVTIIKNTTIINNYGTENNRRYNMGPNATDVQRYTGRNVQPLRVSNASDYRSVGVSNNELRVYRPVTRAANTSGRTTTQPNQPTTRPSTPQTTTQPAQTRPQPTQQPARPSTPAQTRPQPVQQPTRPTPQPATQPSQPATQQNPSREYRPNPEQPRVTNRAAPQQTRQIQAAQQDNQRMHERSTTETQQGRSR